MLPHKTVIGKAAVALDNLTLQNSCRRLFMARKRSAAGPGWSFQVEIVGMPYHSFFNQLLQLAISLLVVLCVLHPVFNIGV
eukprot:SAG31_NODE_26_length_32985_cov_39.054096_14_plen_81_part_00